MCNKSKISTITKLFDQNGRIEKKRGEAVSLGNAESREEITILPRKKLHIFFAQ